MTESDPGGGLRDTLLRPGGGMTPEISVVVPVCNEAENVGQLATEIARALAGREFEILFVDDGSTDTTAAAALASRQ